MTVLANYGNLVLLSNGENGTPLVIKEALMAGLPIVTNKYSADDLDTTLPFIDIIPDDKLGDLEYIQEVINKNLKKQNYQTEIRNYGESNFSWENLVEKYLECINNITLIERSNEQIFTSIYENCMWGNNNNNEYKGSSGGGSDVYLNKDTYVLFLKNFINTNSIKTVVDLGCGDFRCGKLIYDDLNVLYSGYDVYKFFPFGFFK
jgi:hypothetical protein